MKSRLLLSAVILGLSTTLTRAAETERLAGVWDGTLKVRPQVELRFILHVEEAGAGVLKATLDSPDEGLRNLPIDTINTQGARVSFASKALAASFEGTWNEGRTGFAGEWSQRGARVPLSFTKGDPARITRRVVPKELEGLWKGTIKALGLIELRLVLRVERDKQGTLKAMLDSPDQGASGIPIGAIALQDDVLTFEIKLAGIKFTGTKNKDGTAFEGHLRQSGATMPLTLRKTDRIDEPRRPQTPKPPFPYRAEEVAYQNAAGGVTLAGTITIPPGEGPFPAAILITGSGAQDRDETILSHKPFLVLADDLTRRGIAVLRVDDRGVGRSTGSVVNSTSEDFAGDVLAGVAFLKGREEIDPRGIGLIGHSEGATVAAIAAARSGDVAFVVLIAGTGLPGDQLLERQRILIGRAVGMDEAAIKRQNDAARRFIEIIKTEKDARVVGEKGKAMWADFLAGLPETERKALEASGSLEAGMAQAGTPWFRHFLGFDPRPILAKVRCPVLALGGEKDLQVPPKENLAEIEKALKAGGNTQVTTRVLPGLNHLLQTSKTGSPSEYATIEETIAPQALKLIGDWVVAQTKSR